MQDYKKYLKPDVVSRLSNMELRARLVVEGFITGLHKSPYHGFSVEFAEHRQYMPGDEIKKIDWKVYGRTDRYFVKQYEEETNLKSYLLLDASGSMGYTSGDVTKFEYGCYLAGALTYLMLMQRDAVGLGIFDNKLRTYLPPRSVMGYMSQLLKALHNASPGETTNIELNSIAERIKRRGLVILISDLLDEPEKVVRGLQHFRYRQHEVILFHILDPFEVEFSFSKSAQFKDMETEEIINTHPWHILKEYSKHFKEYISYYRRECRANNIDYVFINTAQPFDEALIHYLIKRKKIGG